MDEIILKYALKNAYSHDGKAKVGPVLAKVLGEKPELKSKIKEVIKEISDVLRQVNKLSQEEQLKKLENIAPELLEKKEQKDLPDLPNPSKVIMRMAPYPSGPLHIGNARMVVLNDEYVKRYKGKLSLIIDDTIGSKEKIPTKEAYNLIIDGLKWLDVKYDKKIIYKSDRIEIFYKYAEELIKKNKAYICECPAEILRKNREKGIECSHRSQSINENLKKWKKMLNGGYNEGTAVLRLKTDIKHKNPAFRDRVLLRICKRKHPRVGKKYIVWPMLEFSWAIDDHLLGTTHILRGKDLVMEDLMEDYIWDIFKWKKAYFIHYGLLALKDVKLSKSKARRDIEEGKLTGWDDPRTWSLQALRRRGIQPQAIRKFILNMGLSLADVSVPAEILYAKNKKIIDKKANRYFFVHEPIKLEIKGIKKLSAEILYHPDFPKRGKRKIILKENKVFVSKSDLKLMKPGKEIRLKDLCNIKILKNNKAEFTSKKVKLELNKIQWVPLDNAKIKILMPDGKIINGLAEKEVNKLKTGEIIQFVRFGFCRKDKKDLFVFAHK